MRYRFRLEVVLRLRRAEEERAKEALMTANRRLRQALAARDVATDRYRALSVTLGPLSRATLDAERARASLAAESQHLAQRAVASAAAAAALAQIEWTRAAREVAVLERLDARRQAEHAELVQREEAAVIDDIVALRFASGRVADAWPTGVPA